MAINYFTKTDYKLSLSCPTKLFYKNNPNYIDSNTEDPFIEAIKDSGFQVHEFAKLQYENYHEINDLNIEKAISKTRTLLKNENVVIFGGVLKYSSFISKIDIIEKKKDVINIIEVRAKSTKHTDYIGFLNGRTGEPLAEWKNIMNEIAYQSFVGKGAFLKKVNSSICLLNGNKRCKIDNLNQLFRIYKKKDGTVGIIKNKELAEKAKNENLLIRIEVTPIIDKILESGVFEKNLRKIQYYSKNNIKIDSEIGSKCKTCQFSYSGKETKHFKSGKNECLFNKLKNYEVNKQTVLDLWNYNRTDELLTSKQYLNDLEFDDITPEKRLDGGLTKKQRQWIQIIKSKSGDKNNFIDLAGLEKELSNIKYPLHFIDFETASVPLPYNKNRKPYEGITFQFSHHIIHKNGVIEHKGEFFNKEIGKFPNFDFIRALKRELENDDGTIFKYGSHENTYLNTVYEQLKEADYNDVSDKDELCDWIKTVTSSISGSKEEWVGNRNMIDLLEAIKKYYYSPISGKSNSIKDILPAIINDSKFIQQKYSKPIYGSNKMKSKNFRNKIWVKKSDNEFINPYDLLPPIFIGKYINRFLNTKRIADGGAAMIAYSKLQFSKVTDIERNKIVNGLLKYCELDTFAMVVLWEFFNNELNKWNKFKKQHQLI